MSPILSQYHVMNVRLELLEDEADSEKDSEELEELSCIRARERFLDTLRLLAVLECVLLTDLERILGCSLLEPSLTPRLLDGNRGK